MAAVTIGLERFSKASSTTLTCLTGTAYGTATGDDEAHFLFGFCFFLFLVKLIDLNFVRCRLRG